MLVFHVVNSGEVQRHGTSIVKSCKVEYLATVSTTRFKCLLSVLSEEIKLMNAILRWLYFIPRQTIELNSRSDLGFSTVGEN